MVVDKASLDDLKQRGTGKPAPEPVVALYHRAFREFGALALWSRREGNAPTIRQVLAIAESLRREGNLKSRALAAQIEEACRAALSVAT